ncbi:hypothetical protein, partial [Hafnia paralvei]|uniref:hypothetical protein n=1 Tax=Hafnia paralvei TaxID=546367 RepID=UPI00241D4E74
SARVQRPRAGGLCTYAFTGVSMKLGIDRRVEYYTTVTSANETCHRNPINDSQPTKQFPYVAKQQHHPTMSVSKKRHLTY